MKDLLVIVSATCERGTMRLYLDQLKAAGIDSHIHELTEFHPQGGTLAAKIASLRNLVTRFSDYEKIVFSDAFDVTFYGTKEDVIDKIPESYVLQAGEKNCYPDASLAMHINGSTPWRYSNGGLAAGTPQAFAEWCFAAECRGNYNPNMLDQQFMNERLAQSDPLVKIDQRTRLFFCLFGGYPELEWKNGLPFNKECATYPQFVHANGQWSADEAFRKRDESLGIKPE
jgi:hypothetical protein